MVASQGQWAAAGAIVGRWMLVLIAAVVLVAASLGGGVARPAWADSTPLRQVDWSAVLANDPAITVDPTAFRPPGESGPYIQVAGGGLRGDQLEGYALIQSVEYADLDGDGAEEAIVPIFSGGTAGLLGLLLYREATPAPKLLVIETGYKLGFTIEGRRLVIQRPNYVGFEPNCCPSSTTSTTTVLEGERLVVVATETTPNDVQEATVWAFYNALDAGQYEEAYAFYSPSFQSANPFDRWKAGYATTQHIEVQTSPGAAPTEVLIVLTATDARPGGGSVTRRFRGAWTLVWSGDQKRWLLDRARIEAI
ncbi:MAG: hypothetical protein IT306_11135 [Chloroflexi bacterium]|nr:hypothetical protein [Chloroflexota bacterium]